MAYKIKQLKTKIREMRGKREYERFLEFSKKKKISPSLTNFQIWARATNTPLSKRKYIK